MVTGSPSELWQQTQRKQSRIASYFRAKYRTDSKKVISPLSVVPHPNNRGGDPVKSLRTMQLNGTVAVEGYDPIEANGNGVAVEQKFRKNINDLF